MFEINISNDRWYCVIKNPEVFILHIMYTSLQELKIVQYAPRVSIALADDSFLCQLNLKFRNINKPTNVLSFPNEQLANQCDLGDIAMSIETIERESHEYSIPILTHIAHMLIHGLLHLLEYDHQTHYETIIMENLENRLLLATLKTPD